MTSPTTRGQRIPARTLKGIRQGYTAVPCGVALTAASLPGTRRPRRPIQPTHLARQHSGRRALLPVMPAGLAAPGARRGPVAPGPELAAVARDAAFDRLRRVAEASGPGDLLRRQALYLQSYDRRPDAAAPWFRLGSMA